MHNQIFPDLYSKGKVSSIKLQCVGGHTFFMRKQMCICASSMIKRCGFLIPSRVLSIVLLSMLTQRAAPGARKFLSHTQKGRSHLTVDISVHYFCMFVCLYAYLQIISTFSMILELSPCLISSQACQKHRFSAGREKDNEGMYAGE